MRLDKSIVKVNTAKLKAKLRAAGAEGVRSADVATKIMAGEFTDYVVRNSPRDTNRFVAAWAQAGNQAKLGPYAVPPLVPSKMHDKILPRMEYWMDFWARVARERRQTATYMQNQYDARYGRTGRKGKWEQQARRDLAKAIKLAEKTEALAARAKQEHDTVRDNPTAIVIFGRKRKQDVAAEDDLRVSRLHRGITKVEGGEAMVVRLDHRLYYRLRNKEAHASIVESRSHVVANGLAIARGVGLKRASVEVKKRIKAATTRAA